MSVLLRARPAAAPDTTDPSLRVRSRFVPLTLSAAALTLASVWVLNGRLGPAALGATEVGVLVALMLLRRGRAVGQVRAALPIAGTIVLVAIAAIGALVSGPWSGVSGQVISGWAVVVLVSLYRSTAPAWTQVVALVGAVVAGALFAVVALGNSSASVVRFGLAVPAVIILLLARSSRLAGIRGGMAARLSIVDVGPGPGWAAVVGVGVGAIALAERLPARSSKYIIPAVAASGAAVVVMAGLVRGRLGSHKDRTVLGYLALAAGAFGAGAGSGVASMLTFGAAAWFIAVDVKSTRPLADPLSVDAPALVAREAGAQVDPHHRRRVAGVVGALTLVGIAVRSAIPRGLWLDEATSVHEVKLSLSGMIHLLYSQDNHPPFYFLILWADERLVGNSELALRLPSILLGALLVPMLFITARELYNERVGLLAATIGVVAPVGVWYSQEARMYSLFMFLALVGLYSQTRALRTGRNIYWVVFTASSIGLAWTQYFAVLHIVGEQLVFLILALRERRTGRQARAGARPPWIRKWLISSFFIAAFFAPLIPFGLHQFAHNQQSGFGFSASVASGSTVVPTPNIYGLLVNLVWSLWGYQPDSVTRLIAAMWPFILLVILVLLGRARSTANRYLCLIAAFPAIAIFAGSFVAAKSRSLAEVRYFSGSVPALLILVAAALVASTTKTTYAASRSTTGQPGRSASTSAPVAARAIKASGSRTWALVAGSSLLVASMLAALVVQETSSANPRLYQYREALHFIDVNARPGDHLVYVPEYLNYVLEYYPPRMPSSPLGPGLPVVKSPHRLFLFASFNFADSPESKARANEVAAALARKGISEHKYHWAQVTLWVIG